MLVLAVLGTMSAGAALAVAGALWSFALPAGPNQVDVGHLAQSLGFLLLGTSLAFGLPIKTMPDLKTPEQRYSRAYELRQWQILKVASILLNMLAVLAVVALVAGVMLRTEVVQRDISRYQVNRIATLLVALIAANAGFAYFQSFRTRLELDRTGLTRIFHGAAVSGLAVTAATAAWTAVLGDGIGQGSGIDSKDTPVLLLAAGLFAALDLFVVRSLPTLYVLLSEERAIYQGHTHFSKTKSVLVPTMFAFAMLFMVFLLFLVFGVGAIDLFKDLGSSPLLLSVLATIIVALGASVASAMMMTRTEDKPVLFQEQSKREKDGSRTLLSVSLGLAFLFMILALLVGRGIDVANMQRGRWVDLFSIGLLVGLGPYGFYVANQNKRIRLLEERFPDFLRDLASSHKGGLTLPSAVAIAARGEYGPLTPEIKRMADQLTWNVSFSEALKRFSERVRTPLVLRAVNLILQADRSGGSTTEVLYAAARDTREIKNMENDRRLSMTLYTIVIYITYLVYLVVASILFHQFVPQIIASSTALEGSDTISQSVGFQAATLPEYRAFYFLSAVVQGLGGGIIAGLMGNGRALMGLRHSFIMVGIAYIIFAFFLV